MFISICLFFSSRSLVNFSCISSILFLRSWIIFTIIILNSFSGRLPISTSFSFFFFLEFILFLHLGHKLMPFHFNYLSVIVGLEFCGIVVLLLLSALWWMRLRGLFKLPDRKWSEVKWNESCSVLTDSLRHHGLYVPWNSPGQNTGVGSLFLLQAIFPTQGLNLLLLLSRFSCIRLCAAP